MFQSKKPNAAKLCLVYAAIVGLGAAAFVPHAHAGSVAGFGGSTEITQVLNNVQLHSNVVKTAQTVQNTYRNYQQALLQVRELQRAGKQIKSLGKIPGDIQKEIRLVRATISRLDNLQDNVKRVSDIYKTRTVEAQRLGMTLERYLLTVESKINTKDQRTLNRVKEEKVILEETNQDMQTIQELSSEIQGSEGTNQSLGLLNKQMNKLLQQNNRMIGIMAKTMDFDKVADAQNELAQENARKHQRDRFNELIDQQVAQQRDEINSVRRTLPRSPGGSGGGNTGARSPMPSLPDIPEGDPIPVPTPGDNQIFDMSPKPKGK